MSLGPGAIILGMILAAGSVLGIIAMASSQQPTVVDSMGNVPSIEINQSQGAIINGTAPVAALGGGVVLFLAALVIAGAAILVWRASGGPSHSRRG